MRDWLLKFAFNLFLNSGDDIQKCATYMSYTNGIRDILLIMTFSSILYMGILLLIDLNLIRMAGHLVKQKLTYKNNKSGTGMMIKVYFLFYLFATILDKSNQTQYADQELQSVTGMISKMHAFFFNNNFCIYLDKPQVGQYVANKLKKLYSSLTAVEDVSFSVKESSCFGLLGVNGAGKTSTFKMLSGEEPITEGEAYIHRGTEDKAFVGNDEVCILVTFFYSSNLTLNIIF